MTMFAAFSQSGTSAVVSADVVITVSPIILIAIELSGSGNITAAIIDGIAADITAFLGLDPLLVDVLEPSRRRAASTLALTIYTQNEAQAVDFQAITRAASVSELLPSASGWGGVSVTSLLISTEPPLVSPADKAIAAAVNSSSPPRCFRSNASVASKFCSGSRDSAL